MAMGARVVVVGAGISGLAVARSLAPDHDVVVVDAGGIAADTSSRASGVISLSLEPIPDAWAEFALGWFRDLSGCGIFSFTERDTVRLVPDDVGECGDRGPGGGVFVDRRELRARSEGVFRDLSGYAGGLVYDGTGFLDAVDYAMTVKWLAERAGADLYRDHRVTRLRVEGGSVVGVETDHASIDADWVVYATGWRAREQLLEYVELPVRPLRWNALVLEPDDGFPSAAPMGSDPVNRVYWRPAPAGGVLIGGNEHVVEDPVSAPMAVDDDFRVAVRREVGSLLMGVETAAIRREDCCPTADSASPDGRPIVDAPTAGPDGLVVVTGLHGRGVMLSPVVGQAVRSIVADERAPFPMAPLGLDRFSDRSADFHYVSHWDEPRE